MASGAMQELQRRRALLCPRVSERARAFAMLGVSPSLAEESGRGGAARTLALRVRATTRLFGEQQAKARAEAAAAAEAAAHGELHDEGDSDSGSSDWTCTSSSSGSDRDGERGRGGGGGDSADDEGTTRANPAAPSTTDRDHKDLVHDILFARAQRRRRRREAAAAAAAAAATVQAAVPTAEGASSRSMSPPPAATAAAAGAGGPAAAPAANKSLAAHVQRALAAVGKDLKQLMNLLLMEAMLAKTPAAAGGPQVAATASNGSLQQRGQAAASQGGDTDLKALLTAVGAEMIVQLHNHGPDSGRVVQKTLQTHVPRLWGEALVMALLQEVRVPRVFARRRFPLLRLAMEAWQQQLLPLGSTQCSPLPPVTRRVEAAMKLHAYLVVTEMAARVRRHVFDWLGVRRPLLQGGDAAKMMSWAGFAPLLVSLLDGVASTSGEEQRRKRLEASGLALLGVALSVLHGMQTTRVVPPPSSSRADARAAAFGLATADEACPRMLRALIYGARCGGPHGAAPGADAAAADDLGEDDRVRFGDACWRAARLGVWPVVGGSQPMPSAEAAEMEDWAAAGWPLACHGSDRVLRALRTLQRVACAWMPLEGTRLSKQPSSGEEDTHFMLQPSGPLAATRCPASGTAQRACGLAAQLAQAHEPAVLVVANMPKSLSDAVLMRLILNRCLLLRCAGPKDALRAVAACAAVRAAFLKIKRPVACVALAPYGGLQQQQQQQCAGSGADADAATDILVVEAAHVSRRATVVHPECLRKLGGRGTGVGGPAAAATPATPGRGGGSGTREAPAAANAQIRASAAAPQPAAASGGPALAASGGAEAANAPRTLAEPPQAVQVKHSGSGDSDDSNDLWEMPD